MAYIILVVLGILAVALVAWIYFDATELGKPAVGWALAVPVLGWFLFLPIVLYLIFREQGTGGWFLPAGLSANSGLSPALRV